MMAHLLCVFLALASILQSMQSKFYFIETEKRKHLVETEDEAGEPRDCL